LDHSLPIVSGYSTRSRNILMSQRALGLRPVALTSPRHTAPSPAAATHEMREGVAHYRTPVRRQPRSHAGEVRLMVLLARRIREVVRTEGVRILHAHSPVLNALPALWVGRRLGLPVVYETRAFWEDAAVDHGTTRDGSCRYRLTRALETFVFKRADRVVTIGESLRKEIVQRGVDASRVRVVANGVDTERFRPIARSEPLAHRLGLNGAPVLGFIGSFYRYEGLDFLLETLPEIRRRIPGLRLLLVGGGECDLSLRRKAQSLGDAVTFAGQVPYSEVRDFYSLIDVFVCPRRRMRLTELVTPLKPLEAMAMGRAVLASDVGGLAELIEHQVTGILFAAESRASFVEEAVALAGSAGLRQSLGERARAAVAAERPWRHVVSGYLPIYRELT
ncbi:MAG: TIGR04063 family PEP-CTERM/XrtA system glycosyltransferase, partial [Candidatus Rokuibacteriota bacterium]